MTLDDRTVQAHPTPKEPRGLFRAFADRMLLTVTVTDDPEDMPGVEKTRRAVIERVYSRCDTAERQIRDMTPDPRKLEAERATHEEAAIKAQVSLANTPKWGEERRRDLREWWEVAQDTTKTTVQALIPAPGHPQKPAAPDRPATVIHPNVVPTWRKVAYVNYTDAFEAARAELALKRSVAAKSVQVPPPDSG
ncbi:MAG TPA: hypothetical protein VLZ84_03535 [Asticcacaulis sp.]|nr:hypothetical protein [Asticcacaulis sp.]